MDKHDFEKARRLMRKAGIDAETIQIVLKTMADPEAEA